MPKRWVSESCGAPPGKLLLLMVLSGSLGGIQAGTVLAHRAQKLSPMPGASAGTTAISGRLDSAGPSGDSYSLHIGSGPFRVVPLSSDFVPGNSGLPES